MIAVVLFPFSAVTYLCTELELWPFAKEKKLENNEIEMTS